MVDPCDHCKTGVQVTNEKELFLVRAKIKSLRDKIPNQKKDQARNSYRDMTTLMAREYLLIEFIKSSERK